MQLSTTASRFVLHWGAMGSKWGVNRTVAQIHALLYVSPEALNAEQIAGALGVARSNVSTSLRELQGWRLVRTIPVLGDRREHYETLGDVWEMFEVVLDERKRRELDPTVELLRSCVREGAEDGEDQHTQARLEQMLEFFEATTTWYDELRRLSPKALRRLMRLGSKVRQLVDSM